MAPVVGMWVFLGSSSVLFCALVFSCVMLRVQAPGWSAASAAILPLGQAVASTVVLLLSSAALAAGLKWRARGDARAARAVAGALALGGVFLALQVGVVRAVCLAAERSTERSASGAQSDVPEGAGSPPSAGGLVRSLVFLLAGVHVVHVLAGLTALAVTALPVLLRPPQPHEVQRLELAAMFWHFVDLAWIALFVVLFLI